MKCAASRSRIGQVAVLWQLPALAVTAWLSPQATLAQEDPLAGAREEFVAAHAAARDAEVPLALPDSEVLRDYPYLEREDILQALRYAAWRADERDIPLFAA